MAGYPTCVVMEVQGEVNIVYIFLLILHNQPFSAEKAVIKFTSFDKIHITDLPLGILAVCIGEHTINALKVCKDLRCLLGLLSHVSIICSMV